MHIKAEEPDFEVFVKDLDEGDYFWYSGELHIKPIIEITNTQFAGIENVILVFCIGDESLAIMSPETKVKLETRTLTAILQEEKKST